MMIVVGGSEANKTSYQLTLFEMEETGAVGDVRDSARSCKS